MRDVVSEQDGEFVLPLDGFVCSDWEEYGWLVVIDESGTEARIGLNAEHKARAAALIQRRARVESAVSTDDSELRVVFDGGDVIVVPADPDGEAWEVRVGQGGELLVIAQPGGGKPFIF